MIDEEVATGTTLIEAVNLIKKEGARDVYLVFIHPILAGDAAMQLSKLPVKEFVTTNTIPISSEKKAAFGGRLRIISVAEMLGEVIKRANQGRSVGELFNE